MYGSWRGESLWPPPVAPSPPGGSGDWRVVEELSGVWEGGTVPGFYEEGPWALRRRVAIPDTAWLYIYGLIGEAALYINNRLWYVGDTAEWLVVPLVGPGEIEVCLQGPRGGGVLDGIYLMARQGAKAWPVDSTEWSQRRRRKPAQEAAILSPPHQSWPLGAHQQPVWPLWGWGLGMVWWSLMAYWSQPFREAHLRGPWTLTPPHPLENLISFITVSALLYLFYAKSLLFWLICIGLITEIVASFLTVFSIEKIWQSWLPVLLVMIGLTLKVDYAILAWGGWLIRSGLLIWRVPPLAYLCSGNLFLYLLTSP